MDKLKYIKLRNEDGSYTDSIPISVDGNYIDINGTTLTVELANKANKNEVNASLADLQSEIAEVATGSPKGVYSSVSALVAANPETGVYVVTANGHVYSWTKNGNNAIDLGLYQAVGIADGSINYNTLDNSLKSKANNMNFQEVINKYSGLFDNSEIIPLMNYADVANGAMGYRYSEYNATTKTVTVAAYASTAIMPPFRVMKGCTYITTGGQWVNPWSYLTDLNGNYIGTITRETSDYTMWISPADGYIFPTFQSLSGSSITNFGIYILATGDTKADIQTRIHSEDIFGQPFDYWLTKNKKYSSLLNDISDIESHLVSESRVDNLEALMALYNFGIIPIYNHVDTSTLEEGKYWNNSLKKASANGYNLFAPFFIKKNTTYKLYSANGVETGNIASSFTFLGDKNGNKDTEAVITRQDIHTFSSNKDGYLYLTVMSPSGTSYDYSTLTIVEAGNIPTSYHAYNQPWDYLILGKSYKELEAEVEGGDPVNQVINLTVGSGKDFGTITAAVNSISDSSASKIYNILIDDGTYEERDITLPDYVNIVGASGNKENCIIQGYLPASTPPSQISPSSTFNISKNNEFHNVTITCQNMRYPVHSESNGNDKNWKQIIDNCYIWHKGNQEAIDYQQSQPNPKNVWTSYHAWGEGSSSGAYLKATNSTFRSEESAFYTHAANSISKPYVHILENCHLLGDIFIDDTTSPINGDTLLINNCDIQGRILILGTNKYNMIISGSGIHPIYQKPERVLDERDFPIFTDYLKRIKCTQAVTKGQFVYSDDGMKTVKKATSSTPKELIVGYVVGGHSANEIVPIMTAGSYEPTAQTWPESDSLTAGLYYKVGDDSKLTQTENLNEAIAISATRWYWLLLK